MNGLNKKGILLLTIPLVLFTFSIAGCYLDLYLLTHNYADRPYMI
ncbi:hypothetical protein AR543_p0101 (plasmid) [Paenibacillus bovis]|uniref:Lipoprotein n=1 Tax=Paenibacillus bovis TaxID=1616788 RepID=A0A1X9T4B5_9BACL|nr:hypothetical protein AR543_p0101 [Paenibacillus bovis]